MLRALANWLLLAWPALGLFAIGAAHATLVYLLNPTASTVNTWVGTGLQVIGGLLVLHSIDQNLGLFKDKSLLSHVAGWFRDCPLWRRKDTVVKLSGSASIAIGGSARLSVARKPTTVEERLAALEESFRAAEARTEEINHELRVRIDSVREELGTTISAAEQRLHALQTKIDASAVGGFKQQVFGVLMAVYGTVVSAFA